jgi:hypothetical protein
VAFRCSLLVWEGRAMEGPRAGAKELRQTDGKPCENNDIAGGFGRAEGDL